MKEFDNEDFISLSDFIEDMAAVDFYLSERLDMTQIDMMVKNIETVTPCQLSIEVDENNQIQIGAIPPMYYVETTFMPVFHNIKLIIEKVK